MKFWKVGILLFFLIGFVSTIFAGTLTQTIYSPFNHTVEQESENYNSEVSTKATTTLVDDRYKDFSEYYDDDISEPFCRIGGQYMINVYNDPTPGAAISNVTYKLYYCKTTFDLLRKIQIPVSWKENDLVVYCNDGGNIVSQSTNFDYLTSQLNTYKACIVKNLDLAENNVIIYGLEVGNRIVDNFPEYFYNFNTSTGPVLVDFTRKNETINDWKLKEEYGGTVIVPYIKRTWEECTLTGKDRECITKCKWEPRTIPEALNWTQQTYPQAQVLVFKNNRVKQYTPPKDDEGGIAAGSCNAGPGPDSDTIYSFKLNVYYKNTNLIFTYKDGRDFYFDYDVGDHFYSLSNFYLNYGENGSFVPLLNVFPYVNKDTFDLSRVALFRKQGDKMIYGYEKPINLLTNIFGDSVLPTYIVKLEGFDGYGTSSCMNSLGSFDATNSDIDERSEVVCNGDFIEIISNNINSNDKGYEAFHLFKNIVMGLK